MTEALERGADGRTPDCVAAWRAARQDLLSAPTHGRGAGPVEQRVDSRRRVLAAHRTAAAIDRQLSTGRPAGPAVVLAHRAQWWRERVAALLAAQGVPVLAALTDSAEVLGVAVAGQPELVLVEDKLPGLTFAELSGELAQFAPQTDLAVCAEDAAEAVLVAPDAVVATRRTPPAEVAERVLARLTRADRQGAVGERV